MLKKLLAFVALFLFSCTLVVNTDQTKEKVQAFDSSIIYKSIFLMKVQKKTDDKVIGICSGFAVSEDLLITAGHCGIAYYELLGEGIITDKIFIEYYAPDGEKTVTLGGVSLKAIDSFNDITILRKKGHGLVPLKIATDTPKPHDKVWVVGSPLTFFATSYAGEVIKSHYDMNALYKDKIIVSAFAAGGNSGSCVVNDKGEVVGILIAGWLGIGDVNIVTDAKYLSRFLIMSKK